MNPGARRKAPARYRVRLARRRLMAMARHRAGFDGGSWPMPWGVPRRVWGVQMHRRQIGYRGGLRNCPWINGDILAGIHLYLGNGCAVPDSSRGCDGKDEACPGKPAEGDLGHEPSLTRLRSITLGAEGERLNRQTMAVALFRQP